MINICVYNEMVSRAEMDDVIGMFDGRGADANRPDVDSVMFTLDDYDNTPIHALAHRVAGELMDTDKWKIGWLTYAKMYPGSSLVKHFDMVPVGDIRNGDPISSSVNTFVMYLNDDYDGGELSITDKLEHKPRAGDVVMFPGMDVEHEVLEVHGCPRFTVTVWCIPRMINMV